MKYLSVLLFAMVLATNSQAKKKKNQEVMIEINTNLGTMVVKLYEDVPLHSANFEKLASEGFYNNLLFHRVIKNFMIQGGDPKSKDAKSGVMLGSGENGYRIPAEFNKNHIHKKGALAMARDNNPEKASSGCQFYIVQGKPVSAEEVRSIGSRNGINYTDEQIKIYETQGGTPFLDMNYTVFGELVSGFEVLDAIENVQTGPADRPVQDVKIISMNVKKPKRKFLFF